VDLSTAIEIILEPRFHTGIDPYRDQDEAARSIDHSQVIDEFCQQDHLKRPEATQLARQALDEVGGYVLRIPRNASLRAGRLSSPEPLEVWRVPNP
jgi:hypothetical protein